MSRPRICSAPPRFTTGDGDPDLPRLRPDELLAGRFSIVRFIARGGMGAVYEAEDLSLRTRVALKIIRSALLADTSALERFRREVLLARRVAHRQRLPRLRILRRPDRRGRRGPFPHHGAAGGARRSPSACQQRGRMTTAEALPLVVQMCDGLDAAHAEGVVHRDFKSSNVLLVQRRDPTANGRAPPPAWSSPTSASPGRSRPEPEWSPGSPAAAGMIGTPEYMAPEQVTGGTVTPATDIYALGRGHVRDADRRAALHRRHAPGCRGETSPRDSPGAAHRASWPRSALERPHRPLPGPRAGAPFPECRRGPCRSHRPATAPGTAGGPAGRAARWWSPPPWSWARSTSAARGGSAGPATWRFPKLVELVELNKYSEAMALAQQMQQVLPDDPKLRKLLPEFSRLYNVETSPPGATVEVKPYGSPDAAWQPAGITPVHGFRLPLGFQVWRIRLPGHETVMLGYPSPYAPPEATLKLALDRVGTIPPEMVRVPGRSVGLPIPGIDHLPRSCSATTRSIAPR